MLAPEHPLVDSLCQTDWPAEADTRWTGGFENPRSAIEAYRAQSNQKSDLDRQENKDKTGVFLVHTLKHLLQDKKFRYLFLIMFSWVTELVPLWLSQVKMNGLGICRSFGLDIIRTVQPPADWDGKAYVGDGPAINSDFLNGLAIIEAKSEIIRWLEDNNEGSRQTSYKLRDWLFSRQRYWGNRSRSFTIRMVYQIPYQEICCQSSFRNLLTGLHGPLMKIVILNHHSAEQTIGLRRYLISVTAHRNISGIEYDASVGGFVLVLPQIPRSVE